MLDKHIHWEVTQYEISQYRGDVEYDYLAPIGLGLPFERDIVENLHQYSMHGGDKSALMVSLCHDTAKFLSNFHLGEHLLMFVRDKLEEYHPSLEEIYDLS